MKKVLVLLMIVAFTATIAMAQGSYSPTTDVLGAHNNHGRGCAGCHAPHSGPAGNGKSYAGDTSWVALWGQDVTPLYGQTLNFGDNGKFTVVLPSSLAGDSHLGGSDPRVGGLLLCLSCHDGKLAKGTMMTNQVFETLPATYGTTPIPTLLEGEGGADPAGLQNDHPVGENAIVGCGGTWDWDCTDNGDGTISMNGAHSGQFANTDYGWTAKPSAYNNKPIVVCTSCHNQHVMNVYKGTIAGTTGYFKTYFGVKGNYNVGSTSPTFNATAQFCRQCHGGESNEMNNANIMTVTDDN